MAYLRIHPEYYYYFIIGLGIWIFSLALSTALLFFLLSILSFKCCKNAANPTIVKNSKIAPDTVIQDNALSPLLPDAVIGVHDALFMNCTRNVVCIELRIILLLIERSRNFLMSMVEQRGFRLWITGLWICSHEKNGPARTSDRGNKNHFPHTLL